MKHNVYFHWNRYKKIQFFNFFRHFFIYTNDHFLKSCLKYLYIWDNKSKISSIGTRQWAHRLERMHPLYKQQNKM